jgi:NADH-quinone oxidoreductase subunit L
MTQNLWIIPILPFIGFLINGIFGRRLPKMIVSLVAVASVLLSFGWVMKVYLTAGDLGANPVTEHYFTWIRSGAFNVGWDFTVDKLTMIMLMIVTGVGSQVRWDGATRRVFGPEGTSSPQRNQLTYAFDVLFKF